jgi:hypothetical protein
LQALPCELLRLRAIRLRLIVYEAGFR